MKITDLLGESAVRLDGAAVSKEDVIHKMVELIAATGAVSDTETYRKAVLAREESGSTGMGEGVAIPHAKTSAVTKPALAAMVLPDGVDYDSLDGEPAHLVFLIAAPDTEDNIHLDVLSRLSVLLMDDGFREALLGAKSVSEFRAAIDRAEKEKFPEEEAAQRTPKAAGSARLLAVTACPTGIAHTYMAAESLEKKAVERDILIKVETNGSGGVKNALTAEDIRLADAVIIAADKDVEMSRFDGKPVVFARAADGINRAGELIEKALSGTVPLYRHRGAVGEAEGAVQDSFGRRLYKSLMNGVSHMLPFVIGGGILIALSFLFDSANAGTDVFGNGTPLSAFLNQIGNLAFGLMFPILAGFIAMAIGDRPALMLGMVGGMIAKTGFSLSVPQEQWASAGFLGAIFAGFIAGYLMLGIRKLLGGLPRALEGTKPVLLYPVLGILAIALIMVFIVNPPMVVFNNWLNGALNSMGSGSRVVLGIVLGGMMSIDFGGPINKAAYVFGTVSIAGGQHDIMAAVMIGGMVPPLAIALATTFFKSRFTKSERQTSLTNYIMGLSFITEGAIPFAASDPLRVIPPCAIGSAVAGGLSMLFGCGSPAPHGGIFVIGIIEHPLMFLVALAGGSLVGMLLLAVFKKPLPHDEGGSARDNTEHNETAAAMRLVRGGAGR